MTPGLIAKLKVERADLQSKLISLELYLMDEEYQELRPEEKRRLSEQHAAMQKYSNVLLERIKHEQELKYQEARQEEAAELPDELPAGGTEK